jgi:hypothetical protein
VQRLPLAAAYADFRWRRQLSVALLEPRLDEVAHEPVELAVDGFGDELLEAAVHRGELVVHLHADDLGEVYDGHKRECDGLGDGALRLWQLRPAPRGGIKLLRRLAFGHALKLKAEVNLSAIGPPEHPLQLR